jgi:RNA polymerase sigma-70 factor (ECF subfamily)
LGDEARAVEVMQETFVNLISKQAELNAESPSSLLYRMATNLCLNIIRSEQGRRNKEESGVLTEILQSSDPRPRWESWHSLFKIFSRQKEVSVYISVLFFLDGMTLEEISTETGLSVSGVRKHLQKIKVAATKHKERL